jgi:hypothetical protein
VHGFNKEPGKKSKSMEINGVKVDAPYDIEQSCEVTLIMYLRRQEMERE